MFLAQNLASTPSALTACAFAASEQVSSSRLTAGWLRIIRLDTEAVVATLPLSRFNRLSNGVGRLQHSLRPLARVDETIKLSVDAQLFLQAMWEAQQWQ